MEPAKWFAMFRNILVHIFSPLECGGVEKLSRTISYPLAYRSALVAASTAAN